MPATVVTALVLGSAPWAVRGAVDEFAAAFHDAQQTCDEIAWVDQNRMARPTGYDADQDRATLQARLERQADAFRNPAGIHFLQHESGVADEGIQGCARRLLHIVVATPAR
jgi:hypothetical protein